MIETIRLQRINSDLHTVYSPHSIIKWQGRGVDEKGIDNRCGKTAIQIEPIYFRPADVDPLLGDSTKTRTLLGWELMTSFEGGVNMMTDVNLALSEREKRANG